jgi:hypothetical protein
MFYIFKHWQDKTQIIVASSQYSNKGVMLDEDDIIYPYVSKLISALR